MLSKIKSWFQGRVVNLDFHYVDNKHYVRVTTRTQSLTSGVEPLGYGSMAWKPELNHSQYQAMAVGDVLRDIQAKVKTFTDFDLYTEADIFSRVRDALTAGKSKTIGFVGGFVYYRINIIFEKEN